MRLLAIAVLFAACGRTAEPTSSARATSDPAPVASVASVASVAPSASAENTDGPHDARVKVLEAGSEPRVRLRRTFQMKPETVRFDMKIGMAISVSGTPTPAVTLPTIRMDMDVTPVSVDAEGSVTATYVVRRAELLSDAQLPAPSQQKMADDLHAFVGAKGRFVVTSRGFTKDSTFDLTDHTPESVRQIMDSLRDAMRNISSPFPEEPVGVGARWEHQTDIEAKAVHLVQTATYTLTRHEGNVIEEDVSVVQSAPPQEMHLPQALPAGTKVNLLSSTLTGKGHMRLALDRYAPTSTFHSDSLMKMETVASGKAQAADVALTLDTRAKGL